MHSCRYISCEILEFTLHKQNELPDVQGTPGNGHHAYTAIRAGCGVSQPECPNRPKMVANSSHVRGYPMVCDTSVCYSAETSHDQLHQV